MNCRLIFLLLFTLNSTALRAEFITKYERPVSSHFNQIATVLQRSGLLENVSHVINSRVNVPSTIPIVARECGSSSPFYSARNRAISFCYEFIGKRYPNFQKLLGVDLQTAAKIEASFYAFVLYHEAGHAIIDQLNLSVLGNEEDAADNFALFFTLSGDRSTVREILWGTIADHQINSKRISMKALGDTHALEPQRLANVVCKSVGFFPELQNLARDRLPPDRLANCPNEYARMNRSVRQQLAGYLLR